MPVIVELPLPPLVPKPVTKLPEIMFPEKAVTCIPVIVGALVLVAEAFIVTKVLPVMLKGPELPVLTLPALMPIIVGDNAELVNEKVFAEMVYAPMPFPEVKSIPVVAETVASEMVIPLELIVLRVAPTVPENAVTIPFVTPV